MSFMGAPASNSPNPDSVAKSAALRACRSIENRPPSLATQQCVLNIIEPASLDSAFAQLDWKTWPSARAKAFDQMLQQLDNLTSVDEKDRMLVAKFITEQIGIEGCKFQMRINCKENIPDSAFKVFHGPNVVNLYYIDSVGVTHVGEAKGGTSQLKEKQGTIPDLKRVAKKMENSKFRSQKLLPNESEAQRAKRCEEEMERRKSVGKDLRMAIADESVEIIAVQTATKPLGTPTMMEE